MPFDPTPQETTTENPTTLYRQRRESAAALWQTISPRKFRMDSWRCGTTACALGWLAQLHHDWYWNGDLPYFNNKATFYAAMEYFAIDQTTSSICFGILGPRTRSDVAKYLLAAPYHLPHKAES